MTITKTMVEQVSPFSVDDSGNFTETDYDQYVIWAGLELDQIDPGLDSATYDYCHALLVCHFYECSLGSTGKYKSEKIGDYSYTRFDNAQTELTSYYNRVLQILAQFGTEQPTTVVERDDADTTFPKAAFKLDQSAKVRFE